MQRGVDLPSLDVTYFTSLSYYILLLFGLRGVFMLFFRENTIDETQMYRQQMGMGGGGNPMAAMTSADPNKALEAERAALEMVRSALGQSRSIVHERCVGHYGHKEVSGCQGTCMKVWGSGVACKVSPAGMAGVQRAQWIGHCELCCGGHLCCFLWLSTAQTQMQTLRPLCCEGPMHVRASGIHLRGHDM